MKNQPGGMAAIVASVIVMVAACGGEVRPVTDAGSPPRDAGEARDAGEECPAGFERQGVECVPVAAQLSVVSTSPGDGATYVHPDAEVLVTFSSPLAEASVTPRTFEMTSGNTIVAARREVRGATLALVPEQPLLLSTEYTVRVSTGVQATDGAALERDLFFTFTTQDYLRIVSLGPTDGATEVPVRSPVRVVFSEPLDEGSIDARALVVSACGRIDGQMYQGEPLPGVVSVSGTELSYLPDRGSFGEFETVYWIDVGTTIRSIHGQRLEGPSRTHFTSAMFDYAAKYDLRDFEGFGGQWLYARSDRRLSTTGDQDDPASNWSITRTGEGYFTFTTDAFGSNWLLECCDVDDTPYLRPGSFAAGQRWRVVSAGESFRLTPGSRTADQVLAAERPSPSSTERNVVVRQARGEDVERWSITKRPE